MIRCFILLTTVFCSLTFAIAKDEVKEAKYLCEHKYGGVTESVLPDRTRVDILTKTHAYEVDWASKWAEGIGQALYYSSQTGKRPGVILLVKNKNDLKYVIRARKAVKNFKVDVPGIGPCPVQIIAEESQGF